MMGSMVRKEEQASDGQGYRRTQRYAFFLATIPVGFKGVAGLSMETGRILLTERETGRTISLKSARTW